MEVTAQLRQLRIAPRKVRLVANVIRGLSVIDAETQLLYLDKRAAAPLLKLIRSAASNAEHNFKMKRDDLVVKKIQVNKAVTLKRWKPRAMGRATPIAKQSAHVVVVLDTKVKRSNGKKD
ncbi:MAG: 50S ribosomal protein L22 [Candidatus Kerfeldbacteria bacterium]|nr:50S ribosomal protein L22 [Candidatus Kerfeldbacteria bacterium]